MSETQVIGKPLTASIRVSSTDAHKITTPVPRPLRGGAETGATKRSVTGEPIRPQTPDVTIGRLPAIEATTSSSTARSSKIVQPAVRHGRQPQREGLPGSTPRAHVIAADEANLIDDLLRAHYVALPEDDETGRQLARKAAATIDSLR